MKACGHGRYIAQRWGLLKLCTCRTCGHKWTVVLTPDGSESSW
jgi:hypothetical protein